MGVLRGHQLQPRELAALNYDAGWQDAEQLVVAVMVELAESQGYDHAENTNPDGTRDRGVWQLNSVHKQITDEIAFDPKRATAEAFKLYVARGDFTDWAAYNSGVYLHDSYLGRACVGVANFLAERFLAVSVPDWAGKPYEHRFTTPVASFQFRVSGAMEHLTEARKLLGWQPASAAKVQTVQAELSKGQRVIKATLPGQV